MPVIAVDDDAPFDAAALRAAARALPPGAPVVVMVHGFRWSPFRADRDPHRTLFSPLSDRGPSWARHLRLGGPRALGVGYGWEGGGTIWRAQARARDAGARLARLAAGLREDAGRPVHAIAHSLGARVALAALAAAPPGTFGRLVLLAAAATRGEARVAAARGRGPGAVSGAVSEVVNVVAAENRPFDLLFRAALPHGGPTVAQGAGPMGPGWLDLSLDDLPRLEALGWPVAPRGRRACHWSGYTRPGVWPLYRALLWRPEATPLGAFRAPLAPRPARAILPPVRRRESTHGPTDRAALLAHAQWLEDQHRA